MKRRSGALWLGGGVVLAVMAALLTFRLLSGVAPTSAAAPAGQETVPVVVARVDVPMRTLLTEEEVMVRQVSEDWLPEGAATSLDQVLGKISKQDLVEGEVVLLERLVDPNVRGLGMLFTIPEDKLLVALPGADLMSRTGLLKAGDKIDILYTVDVAGGTMTSMNFGSPATISALQNQEIQAIVLADFGVSSEAIEGVNELGLNMEAGESALLVAVDPQDALVLKHLRDIGGVVDFALRVPTNEQLMPSEAVTQEYLLDRYQIDVDTSRAGYLDTAFDWPVPASDADAE